MTTTFASMWVRLTSVNCAGLVYDTGRLRKNGGKLFKPKALFHDLRRTAATNMDSAGISHTRIMEIVGWETDAMFERYRIGSVRAASIPADRWKLGKRRSARQEQTERRAPAETR
jgi:hypothetical protein